jgi:hypothetical protein
MTAFTDAAGRGKPDGASVGGGTLLLRSGIPAQRTPAATGAVRGVQRGSGGARVGRFALFTGVVLVLSGCSEGTAPKPIPPTQISLAPGAATLVAGSMAEIAQTGGRYMIAVVKTGMTLADSTGFQLRGSLDPQGSSVVGSSSSIRPFEPYGTGTLPGEASIPQQRDAHLEMLDADRELVRRLGAPRAVLRGDPSIVGPDGEVPMQNAVPLQVGAEATLKVRTLESCETFNEVTGRVVYVGTRSVIIEADDAPLKGQMDADFQAIGAAFDNEMYAVLEANFGNPLAYDNRLDNNGRVIMLFTRRVNNMGTNLMGFVTSCDFYPPGQHPSVRGSNQAEIFYARVPLDNTPSLNSFDSRVGWLRNVRSTVMHEGKHLVSYAERFSRATGSNPTIEENWLEEGTAQVAVELYARQFYYGSTAAWKANATYQGSIYCDFRPTVGACAGRPFLVADHFLFLHDYMRNVEQKSFMSASSTDATVYGSAWLFIRWAADQFASSEAAFFRALTQEPTLTGMANVQARTGRTSMELITNYMLALYADDFPGMPVAGGARYTIPSWNLRDIFSGLAQDFPSSIVNFPLPVRQVAFGDFQRDVAKLFAASASYFEMSGSQSGVQHLELRAPGGGTLPAGSTLRMYVLRVQ